MKIDLVYLWVDGSDEKWLAKKNAVLQSLGRTPAKHSISAKRWTDHDELKYSLRSVEKFASWINHIFIVSDEQTPDWLNTENKKITIIDHKQIIPNDKLPLFNSNAIEMFLWKIPELSEYFLYANDDMFFGKQTLPDFFFDKNRNPIVIMKERARKFDNLNDDSQVSTRLYSVKTARTIKFAYKKLKIKYNLTFKHAIEPIRKSYMEENFNELKTDLFKTTITPFRDVNNIQRIIMPLFDNAKKRNVIVLNWRPFANAERIVYDYERDNFFRRFYHKLLWIFTTVFSFVEYDCYDKQWRLINFLKKYEPTLFAISDFSDKKSSFDVALTGSGGGLMQKLFPQKSEFEK